MKKLLLLINFDFSPVFCVLFLFVSHWKLLVFDFDILIVNLDIYQPYILIDLLFLSFFYDRSIRSVNPTIIFLYYVIVFLIIIIIIYYNHNTSNIIT